MDLRFWKYFRDKKKDNYSSINNLLNNIYSNIGEHYSHEVKGNTPRNKGIKKIISHCKLKYGYEPSATEIKSILRTRNYNLIEIEYYKIPYGLGSIFKSIIDLCLKIDEIDVIIKKSIEERKLNQPVSSHDILIPGIYDCLENINNNKDNINIFSSNKNKILALRNEIRKVKGFEIHN